jgi:hypothetical protein
MTNDGSGGSISNSPVARILYKEIFEGDLRKIEAKSNDSDTGGGARDFRFGSFDRLLPVIKKMFPQTVKENRVRDRKSVQIDVFKGTFYWQEKPDAPVKSKTSYFEPPTTVRPTEGRIVRVHEYGCFDVSRVPKFGVGNRVLLLLVQRDDDSVWPHYAEERSLRTPNAWDHTVATEILRCLDARRSDNTAVIGFRDFQSNLSYCNGK